MSSPSDAPSSMVPDADVNDFPPQDYSLLKCNICQHPSASPIFSCTTKQEHLTCGLCFEIQIQKDKDDTNCFNCKAPLTRNLTLEQWSRLWVMKRSCPFVNQGCESEVEAASMQEHLMSCEYRKITSIHKLSPQPVDGGNCNLTFELKIPLRREDERSLEFWEEYAEYHTLSGPKMLTFDKEVFQFCSLIKNSTLFWWIVILGGEKEAKKYKYVTKIVAPPNRPWPYDVNESLHLLSILPFHKYVNFDPFLDVYASASAAKLSSSATPVFVECRHSKVSFDVSVQIVKSINDTGTGPSSTKKRMRMSGPSTLSPPV